MKPIVENNKLIESWTEVDARRSATFKFKHFGTESRFKNRRNINFSRRDRRREGFRNGIQKILFLRLSWEGGSDSRRVDGLTLIIPESHFSWGG